MSCIVSLNKNILDKSFPQLFVAAWVRRLPNTLTSCTYHWLFLKRICFIRFHKSFDYCFNACICFNLGKEGLAKRRTTKNLTPSFWMPVDTAPQLLNKLSLGMP